ncbi:thiamine-phosphate kinase [Pseudodesulfovibrio sp. F-1]|uniref:Thiamine-monophosphate kinase n=1 Tax=Pseudodesulfovibrio alkaliphilus TaxID=2661613 RepID=A0A7K1KQK5_9BACT|nr:thiamine-phosphate kinase [Pseudodesulfovibrio alkaliphilus]MUM78378.1 thiamine-phosphate kinase [Pseudodesulfovibrio alkaliphilus]
MKSEQDFLDLIDTHFTFGHELLRLGRGDDCAVLAGGRDICVSSDLFLEDVHFRRDYFTAEDIGHKALAVNISDIAAMGARPFAFTMDLMVPPGLDEEFWNGFFQGMATLARHTDMALAGGDLSRADRLGVSISIFGVGGSKGRFLTRGNCAPGDILFTVGELGLARVGLLTLEALGRQAREEFPTAALAHLRPKPKVMIGTLLNAAGVKGLMDVSDGLARDLPRFLGPNLGADLTLRGEMLNGNVVAYALAMGLDPVELTVLGGEDYALLGCVSEEEFPKAASVPGFTEIGRVTEAQGIRINGTPFSTPGFDHFENPQSHP